MEVAARTQIRGSVLILRDAMIFPIGQSRARIGVAALRAIAQSVVKDLGGVRLFSRVVVRGDRTKNGRSVRLDITDWLSP